LLGSAAQRLKNDTHLEDTTQRPEAQLVATFVSKLLERPAATTKSSKKARKTEVAEDVPAAEERKTPFSGIYLCGLPGCGNKLVVFFFV
jgi:predicted ATPase